MSSNVIRQNREIRGVQNQNDTEGENLPKDFLRKLNKEWETKSNK